MINKNNGFTLIELIIVIAILGSLGVIITISLTSVLGNTHQSKCDDFVVEVEDAACVYVGLSNKKVECPRSTGCDIPLRYLVENGLVKSETDNCTNEEIDLDETVTVSWDDNGEKHCEYNGVKEYER